jgi:hypothetical protein
MLLMQRTEIAMPFLIASHSRSQWILPRGSRLSPLKHTVGNLNIDVSFVATLLVQTYLETRFAITDFDAAVEALGPARIDVVAKTADGTIIIGTLKTTKPISQDSVHSSARRSSRT